MTAKKSAKKAPAGEAGAALPVLPLCTLHPEGGYSLASAELEAFAIDCALHGFDLPKFDLWLGAMESCGAKEELLERRQWAWEAVRRDQPKDSLLRHLEWMLLRWRYIRREEYILPLARTGDRVKKGGAKGGQARKEYDPVRAVSSKQATILAEAKNYTGKSTAKVATIARKVGATTQYVRKVLKKTGNRKPL